MELAKLPLVIRDNKWTKEGLIKTDDGLLVPAYVGSQLGFTVDGRESLKTLYESLERIGVKPLCPFEACAEYLDLNQIRVTLKENHEFWESFNDIIGPVNYDTLMPKSKMMIAICEGHSLDDGLCAEIGHYATRYGRVKDQ